jgi:hypothetical protein
MTTAEETATRAALVAVIREDIEGRGGKCTL